MTQTALYATARTVVLCVCLFSTGFFFATAATAADGDVELDRLATRISQRVELSAAEKSWVAASHVVRIRASDIPPYVFATEKPKGLAIDFLHVICQAHGLRCEIIPLLGGVFTDALAKLGTPGAPDIIPSLRRTPERERLGNFTLEYLFSPWVILTRTGGAEYLGSIDDLKGKNVLVEKGYVIGDKLRADVPGIRFTEVANTRKALETLALGGGDAYVGSLTQSTFLIAENGFSNLKIAAPTPYPTQGESMIVRKDWPELTSLIDKSLAAMTLEDKQQLRKRWIAINVETGISRTYFAGVSLLAMLLLAFLVVSWRWNRRLKAEVTARMQAETELRTHRDHLEELVEERTASLAIAKQLAETASHAKSTFLANMSHELRTPMTAIMGMVDLVLRKNTDPKQRDQLAKAKLASQHLLLVINNILDISKIEADRLLIESVHFTLGEVLENLVSLIGQNVTDKGLKLRVDVPPDLARLGVLGDPLRLGQILLNFTANAIKFTAQGEIIVRLSLVERSANDLLLRGEVIDSGIGITADDQRRLFTAFEQADGSMTRKYGGTGLGLAISQRLAKLMGGEVGIISAVGQGSTFWFTARLNKDSAAVPPEPTFAHDSAESPLRAQFCGKRVLLAEDEPVSQEVLRGLLDDVGLVVDVADDGHIALGLARAHHYALILMDMQMPNLNGVDATREIRRESLNTDTPILAVTANAFDDDRQRCLDAGMNDHIAKPVDPKVLFTTLLKWLARPITAQ